MISLISDNIQKKEFNALANHPLQSWEWGEARKKMGLQLVRFKEESENRKNVFQMTIHPISHTPYFLGYIPRSLNPSEEAVDYISKWGEKHNLIFVKFEPDEQEKIDPRLSLVRSSHELFPEWTQTLDITPSEDILLKNMKPKTRYNIKLAQKKGVIVKEMSDEKGFEIFSKLYFETCKRQHYLGHTPSYHKTIWDTLKDDISHILIAWYNNTPLAAYELFYFKKTFYYPYGGTSLLHRNVMGANLLMWEAIRLGKKLGAHTFDMWGSLPPQFSKNHDWSGFSRFKEGYGTTFVQKVGSYDLVIKPTLYNLYSLAYKGRKLFLSLKKSV